MEMKKGPLRVALGVILGGCAGLSLTTSILPLLVGSVSGIETFFVRMQVAGYAAHTAILWALGGGATARWGGNKVGTVALGACGLLSGAWLSFFVLRASLPVASAGTLGALVYGVVGGLILGTVFTDHG
jgi:hypothetical protein